MDFDSPDTNVGSTPRKTKDGPHIYPVSPGESGEGLPYAPEDWPNPGDKWRWKAGKRVIGSGYIQDRYLYLPNRLVKPGQPKSFRSKYKVEQYVQSTFPATDVNSFFVSFSWNIPSKQLNSKELLGAESHLAHTCKAGSNMCTSSSGVSDRPLSEAMFCDICCSEPDFCRNCCCIICSKTIGSYNYIRCKAILVDGCICGHIAHIDCALQAHMVGTVGGSYNLDAEYFCFRCDSRTDLVSHIMELLQICESIDSRDEIETILNSAISILQGSEKLNARQLLHHIESVMAKLKNGANFEDMWKMEESVLEVITAQPKVIKKRTTHGKPRKDNVKGKRQRMATEPNAPDIDNDFTSGKDWSTTDDVSNMQIVLNEPMVDNKQPNPAKTKGKATNPTFKSRSHPGLLTKAIKELNDSQRKGVKEIGFGGLLELDISDIPAKMTYWLVINFNPKDCSLELPKGIKLHIKPEDVGLTLGFPRGKTKIQKRKRSEDFPLLDRWRSLFGKNDGKITPAEVSEAMLACTDGGEWFKRHFTVLVISTLIESTQSGYANQQFMSQMEDVSKLAELNWCDFVVTSLIESKLSWEKNNQNWFTGPLLFLTLFYVDLGVVQRMVPALQGWNAELLKQRELTEINSGGFGFGYAEEAFFIEMPPLDKPGRAAEGRVEKERPTTPPTDEELQEFVVRFAENLMVLASTTIDIIKMMQEAPQEVLESKNFKLMQDGVHKLLGINKSNGTLAEKECSNTKRDDAFWSDPIIELALKEVEKALVGREEFKNIIKRQHRTEKGSSKTQRDDASWSNPKLKLALKEVQKAIVVRDEYIKKITDIPKVSPVTPTLAGV